MTTATSQRSLADHCAEIIARDERTMRLASRCGSFGWACSTEYLLGELKSRGVAPDTASPVVSLNKALARDKRRFRGEGHGAAKQWRLAR